MPILEESEALASPELELLAGAPLTSLRVVELGATDQQLASRYAALNPAASYLTTPAFEVPATADGFDLIVMRAPTGDPHGLLEQLRQAASSLAPSGYILLAHMTELPLDLPAGLRIVSQRACESPAWSIACLAPVTATPEPPLNIHYRFLAPAMMDIRTRLPAQAMARDPELVVTSQGNDAFFPSRLPMPAPKIVVNQRPRYESEAQLARDVSMLIWRGWISVLEIDDHPAPMAAVRGVQLTDWDLRQHGYFHAIQTSTPRLAAYLAPFNPNVAIFSNAAFELPPFPIPAAPLKIFYGSLSRGSYSVEVMRSLAGVASRFPDVEFVVVRDRAVFDAVPTANKRFYDGLPYEDYLRVMQGCDVWLSPLQMRPGMDCKSDAGFVDASRHGLVTIASPTVYADTVADGETGFIAMELADWAPLLERVLADPDERARVGRNAWAYVRDHRMFAYEAARRRDWYKSLWAQRIGLTHQLIARAPRVGEAMKEWTSR